MKKYKTVFPDVFTLFNLFCGFWALISLLGDQPYRAVCLVFLASVADGLDGRIARATKVDTRFGLELDSLVDMVSFGAVPSILLYSHVLDSFGFWAIIPCFMYLSAVAIRLARFNLAAANGHKKSYMGLPSPISALTICSFYLFIHKTSWLLPVWTWLVLTVILSCLMVSTVSYDPLPNITFKESKSNTIRLVLLFFMLILLPAFREITFFPFIITYVVFGLLRAGIHILANTKTHLVTRYFEKLNL